MEKRKTDSTEKAPKKKRLQRAADLYPTSENEEEVVKVVGAVPVVPQPSPEPVDQPPVKKQSTLSRFFSSSKPTSSASKASASNSGKVPMSLSSKKFSRTQKNLVTKKEMPVAVAAAPVQEPASSLQESNAIEILDDDDDDFQMIDDSIFEQAAASTSKSIFANVAKKDDATTQHKPSTPKTTLKKASPPQASPKKVSSPEEKHASPPKSAEKRKHDTAHLETPAEHKKQAFRGFLSRGGPIAPGSKTFPIGKPNCLQVRI